MDVLEDFANAIAGTLQELGFDYPKIEQDDLFHDIYSISTHSTDYFVTISLFRRALTVEYSLGVKDKRTWHNKYSNRSRFKSINSLCSSLESEIVKLTN